MPRVGSGVVRTDPLRFRARCHTHTLRFNGHFSRWTWVSRLPLNSPSPRRL